MQEKIEDIEKIQTTLWSMYKEFLSRKNKEMYRKQTLDLVYSYEGKIKWFCRDLISAWNPVIDLIEWHMERGIDIEKLHSNIMDIQNSVWAAYKVFLKEHQIPEYTEKSSTLVKKYENDKDMMLFAQILILSWVPVIHSLADDFRNGLGG